MWYSEQQDHFGQWQPRTSESEPVEAPAKGSRRAVRAVKEVSAEHASLGLVALSGIYGTKVPVPDTPSPPHVPAAFINALREEGTKEEACDYLQKIWNRLCSEEAVVRALDSEVAFQKKCREEEKAKILRQRDLLTEQKRGLDALKKELKTLQRTMTNRLQQGDISVIQRLEARIAGQREEIVRLKSVRHSA